MSGYVRTANTSSWAIIGRLRYDYLSFYDFDTYGFEFSVLGANASSRIQSLINDINSDPTSRNHYNKNNLAIIDDEYVSFDRIIPMPNGGYRAEGVARGLFDTLPESHLYGTLIYFIYSQLNVNSMNNGIVAKEGNVTTEDLEITTGTVDQEQEFNMDEVETITTTRRAERPSIVANLRFAADRGTFTKYYYGSSLVGMYGGDLLFDFIGRNKFNYPFIIGQTEYTPIIDMYAHVKFCISVDCNGVNFLRYFDLRDGSNTNNITNVRFLWADFCNGMGMKLLSNNSVSLLIGTYDETKDLYSHQHYHKNITWNMPIFAGAVLTESDAQTYGNSLISVRDDCIVLPPTQYSVGVSISFNECVLIFIGTPSPNGVLAQDGNTYELSNVAYRIDGYDSSGVAIGHKVDITDGFVIRSGYTTIVPQGEIYYKYTPSGFVQYVPSV